MNTPIAFLNGSFVPIDQARLHVFDMGVVGGCSVSEMARTFRHVPFRLEQHLERLARSLDYVGFETGMSTADLVSICDQVVSENTKLIPDSHDLGVIVFVTAGQNLTYLGRKAASQANQPTVCVHTFPLPFELWSEAFHVGVHLVTVKTKSIPDDVIDPRVKHRSRLHWHLAAREARQVDSGALAILSDHADELTETAAGNLCVVAGGTIITPASHVLEGVSRDFVAELAASMGLGFVHAAVTAEDLSQSDEAFLTSTPYCLLPVTQFNQAPVGSGQPGPIFQKLLQAWGHSVGVDIVKQMQLGSL